MLDYRLRVFRSVAENLNFTRASESLHISQPAVTQHIKALEERYGTPLFVRGAGGISLTPAGRLLVAASSRAAELERATEKQLRSGQAGLSGQLRLGASSTVGQYFLPAVLGKFQPNHPEVELILRLGNTREVADALRADRIDLGLVEGPGEGKNLSRAAFLEDEIVCCVAPGHPLARPAKVAVSDLAAASFLMRELGSGTRDVVERALKRAGLPVRSLNVVLETDSSEVIKGFVAAGQAAAFLSRLAIAPEIASGRLVVVPVAKLSIRREFSFLYPQGPLPSGLVSAFMASVRDDLGKRSRTH
jgi:DNA-binding transcriptional LysR family regulator